MMIQQQDTGVKPPDGAAASTKAAKPKGGLGGAATAATANGSSPAEQQAQRCPRCDSLNTKFCYYNNYSLSQPRHFCKNCRRYWTKGGALRNVPVGGGCRKNKRLKHRDPSCLAALADLDASASSNILASINGCGIPGFGPSTSSLIHDLASEGQRLALSRFGMPMFADRRFMTENEHTHQGGMSMQDLFSLGGSNGGVGGVSGPLLGAFDPNFAGSSYSKPDSQTLLFHPHQTPSHDHLTPFFDHVNAASPLGPTLDHLSSFTAAAPASTMTLHGTANSLSDIGTMDSQLSLLHHSIPLSNMPAANHENIHASGDHEQQQGQSKHAVEGGFPEEMSMARIKGKPGGMGLSDWTTGMPPQVVNASADAFFSHVPTTNQANDSGLWNASWPEMHAALAGSAAAAGAMLH